MVKNPLSLSLADLKSKFETVTLPVTLVRLDLASDLARLDYTTLLTRTTSLRFALEVSFSL